MIIYDRPLTGLGGTKLNAARLYDYCLGGKDNFAAERQAAERITEKFPEVFSLIGANQDFLHRAARYCAEHGVDQFLDLGTGLPTTPALHDVIRAVDPKARVVGTATDPVVLCHARALVDDGDGIRIIEGDLSRSREILANRVVGHLFTPDRPVAVLLVAVADFTDDDERVAASVAALREKMAPGSFLVMSHATSAGSDPRLVELLEEVYAESTRPAAFRTRDQILALFDGLDLVEPGLVDIQHWHPEPNAQESVMDVRILGAIGRKP